MPIVFSRQRRFLLAALALPACGALSAQELLPQGSPQAADSQITVNGAPPADLAGMPEGPEVTGVISARQAERIQVSADDGTSTTVLISDGTQVRSSGGFLGLGRTKLAADALINGLPVAIRTVQWGGGLVASEVRLRGTDLRTASMIQRGTAQRFGEQGAAIAQNAAATEALRGRMADIDQYNLKGTTNVNFAVGKADLTPDAKAELCATAEKANATSNALLLVVGYTDSTGSEDFNQTLSEKRASRVVNYLQQACGWKPYRMLTPTGMAEADPLADNSTPQGKAMNRRVAVNILVSKSVDGL